MTTLRRWDPLRDVASLQTELARFMNGMSGGSEGRQTQAWMPPLDVWETEDSVTYSFDLPGIPLEDITIEAENGRLTVSASRVHPSELIPSGSTHSSAATAPSHGRLGSPRASLRMESRQPTRTACSASPCQSRSNRSPSAS